MIISEHPFEILLEKLVVEEGKGFSEKAANEFLAALTDTFKKACMEVMDRNRIPVNIRIKGSYSIASQLQDNLLNLRKSNYP